MSAIVISDKIVVPALAGSLALSVYAPNTLLAYERDIKAFIAAGGCLPATSKDVEAFLNHAVESGRAYSSIARILSTIRRIHKLQGQPDPTTGERAKTLIRITKRKTNRRR